MSRPFQVGPGPTAPPASQVSSTCAATDRAGFGERVDQHGSGASACGQQQAGWIAHDRGLRPTVRGVVIAERGHGVRPGPAHLAWRTVWSPSTRIGCKRSSLRSDIRALALAVAAGLQVTTALMDEDVTAVCGPNGRHDPERTAMRHGHGAGSGFDPPRRLHPCASLSKSGAEG